MQEFRFERGKGNRMKPEHTYFQVVTLEGVEVKVRFKEVVWLATCRWSSGAGMSLEYCRNWATYVIMDFSSGSGTSTSKGESKYTFVQCGRKRSKIIFLICILSYSTFSFWIQWNIIENCSRHWISLTLGVQQAGDVELPLGQVESLLQVLLVAPGLNQREVSQLRSERAQDGQEDLSTSPARLKVLHTDGATDPRQRKKMEKGKKKGKKGRSVSPSCSNSKTSDIAFKVLSL